MSKLESFGLFLVGACLGICAIAALKYIWS